MSIVFAIIALVKSNEVSKFQMMNQPQLAEQSGKHAGLFSWIAIGLLVLGLIIQYVWFFAMGGMEKYQELLQNLQ